MGGQLLDFKEEINADSERGSSKNETDPEEIKTVDTEQQREFGVTHLRYQKVCFASERRRTGCHEGC